MDFYLNALFMKFADHLTSIIKQDNGINCGCNFSWLKNNIRKFIFVETNVGSSGIRLNTGTANYFKLCGIVINACDDFKQRTFFNHPVF